ncbi:hypothetical protein BDZ94DRAFT_1289958 [Collybia nuda]|uniref:Uncharacterized protein n=1 Tax=Collybia nuda TaxID=64659 RepID=A0A9P5Y832_9AGAR|nr:hypothetical protein BDZ94DRAFT_1289958 [Collybia nuda]
MGFFSSRKTEDNGSYLTTAATADDKSVVHVIRSRFYGKNKGKEREGQPAASFTTHGASAAQTLSDSTGSKPHASSPLTRHANSTSKAGPSILRGQDGRPTLPALSTSARGTYTSSMRPPSSPSPSSRSRNGSFAAHHDDPLAPSPSRRKPTDTVTITLAQRLNELAVANSEGLLNDDEYRLLRQNLFERFSSSAAVPTEVPVVPLARPRPRVPGSTQEGRPTSRPLSNFQVDVDRSPSVRSKSSVTSGVTNFLRRATSRRTPSGSKDYSDTSSIFSSTSATSNIFKRGLSKKTSNSSVRTTTSRVHADTVSISSRHTGVGSDRFHSENSPYSPLVSRSAASIKRLATPPSSFPARAIGNEVKYGGYLNEIFDEEHLKTTAEIRQEILTVEAEARRLMDAFNGLELTTLARVQRRQGRSPFGDAGGKDSSWTLVPDGRSQRRVVITDSDVVSIRSATSGASASRSAYSGRKTVRPKPSVNASLSLNSASRPGSLHRKNSTSSVGSQERKPSRSGDSVPPVPAIPATYGHLSVATGSNTSLGRSTGNLPMTAVPEDGDCEDMKKRGRLKTKWRIYNNAERRLDFGMRRG